MNDYHHYSQYCWMNQWMNERMNEWMNEWMRVYFITVNCKTKVNYLKLLSFSWYVDDDIVVWFSGNLEEWNLLKLPDPFSFKKPLTNKIFRSMMKSFSFSIFTSYFRFSTGPFKGRKFIILIAFSLKFFYLFEIFIF